MENWVYDGMEYGFDITSADCMGKLISACRALKDCEKSNTGNENMSLTEKEMRRSNSGINTFFDTVFGDGSSDVIFSGADTDSVKSHVDAFLNFIRYIKKQTKELENIRKKFMDEYGITQ